MHGFDPGVDLSSTGEDDGVPVKGPALGADGPRRVAKFLAVATALSEQFLFAKPIPEERAIPGG